MNNNNPVFGKKEESGSSFKSAQVVVLLFAIGLIIFFTITFTFSFKERVFRTFFPRALTLAEGEVILPKVELSAQVDNSFKNRMVNLPEGPANIVLKWKTDNKPDSCNGIFWSNVKAEDAWSGPKDKKEGSYKVSEDLKTGVYVYSINCKSDTTDSSGSTITINVGAQSNKLQPYIVSMQIMDDDKKTYDIDKINQLPVGAHLQIIWSTLNTDTPFAVCVASGSWPTIYKDIGNIKVKEDIVLDKTKIYQYKISCSNEYGYDTRLVSFEVK